MYIQSTEFPLKFQYHENEIECISIYEASGIISCDSSESLNVKILVWDCEDYWHQKFFIEQIL